MNFNFFSEFHRSILPSYSVYAFIIFLSYMYIFYIGIVKLELILRNLYCEKNSSA